MTPNLWNSLEIAKLVASLFLPIAIAALGIYIHRITKQFEHKQWRSQKLVEKRLEIYEDIASDLNDQLCYFTYIGNWKEISPKNVIEKKRSIDKKIYLAAPLFEEDFFRACMEFQSLCYETYTGWGNDAKLRTQFNRRKEAWNKEWLPEWEAYFSAHATEPTELRTSYKRLMNIFARDIGVNEAAVITDSGRVPNNIQ
jgi:hypothetical protein